MKINMFITALAVLFSNKTHKFQKDYEWVERTKREEFFCMRKTLDE